MLTVAAIPVAMPTVLSVTMAVGARLLAKKKAIVTRLVAIEELAGVDVLCADKTGTLTQNKLTLGRSVRRRTMSPPNKSSSTAALASRADNNDTIDLAVLGGLKNDQALKAYQLVHFQPFDPVHKRTEADRQEPGRKGVQGDQGCAAGDPGVVGQCRRGEARRRQGSRRIRRARLSFVGRGAGGGRRQMAVSGRAAIVRSAAGAMPRPPSRPRDRWA